MKNLSKKMISFFLTLFSVFSLFTMTFTVQAKSSSGLSLARQTVISEMKKMSIAKWEPSKTYKTYHYYSYGSGGGEKMTWYKGKTYYGLPYSQNPTIVNDINNKINVTYAVFKGSVSKKGTLSRDLGRNDCSSSVVMALQTVDKKIKLTFTSQMRPNVNNLVAVGSYKYYSDKATTCMKNGASVMYSCYAKLKPGDLLIRDGHAAMVVGIDKDKKTITLVHQTGLSKHYNAQTDSSRNAKNNSDKNSTWGVNDKFSFYYAWSNGYIPLASKTLKEDDKKSHKITMCSDVKKVTVSENTVDSVTLSWNKAKGATGYIIYKFKGGEFVKIGSTTKTSFKIDGLKSAKDYRFAVKSYLKYKKVYVNINYSIITATTKPGQVNDVCTDLYNDSVSVKIKWSKISGAQTYYIYQSTSENGKYEYIGSSEKNNFKVDDLDPNETYYYKIAAVLRRNSSKIKGKLSEPAQAC